MNKQEHLLACLAEECSEIQQATMKALRFGLYSRKCAEAHSSTTNAEDIAKECCDLIAVIELLKEESIIKKTGTIQAIEVKKAKVRQYMEVARMNRTLQEGETSFEIEDARLQTPPFKLGAVFIQTSSKNGVKESEYQKILRLLNSDNNELLSMRTLEFENFEVFGFVNLAIMKKYNINNHDIETFVYQIISNAIPKSPSGLHGFILDPKKNNSPFFLYLPT